MSLPQQSQVKTKADCFFSSEQGSKIAKSDRCSEPSQQNSVVRISQRQAKKVCNSQQSLSEKKHPETLQGQQTRAEFIRLKTAVTELKGRNLPDLISFAKERYDMTGTALSRRGCDFGV